MIVSEPVTLMLWIAGQFVTAAAIWGGIRADVKSLHERIARAELAADSAHKRIDDVLNKGR